MLAALLIFLIGVPVAIDLHLLPILIIRLVSFSLLLIIGLWSLRKSGLIFKVSVGLVVVGTGLNLLSAYEYQLVYLFGSTTAILIFLATATAVAMKQIALDSKVSTNRIIGAICVYLMLGVIWALMYSLLEAAVPGSFGGIVERSITGAWDPDWVYFSFVTLTTLGYGDIRPVSRAARLLTSTEAVIGQLYIAILIARLVSVHASSAPDEEGLPGASDD